MGERKKFGPVLEYRTTEEGFLPGSLAHKRFQHSACFGIEVQWSSNNLRQNNFKLIHPINYLSPLIKSMMEKLRENKEGNLI